MKHLLSVLLAAVLLLTCAVGASAFTSDGVGPMPNLINGTHRWLVDRSFVILENEQPAAAAWFDEQARSTIREYMDWPDHNERAAGEVFLDDFMAIWHSYRPEDGTNTLGNQNGNAAKRLAHWYEAAVAHYMAGDTQAAFADLGKSLHYLTDLLSPPHTGERSFDFLVGAQVFNPLRLLRNAVIHGPYELLATAAQRNYAVDAGGLYDWSMEHGIEEIGHENALFSVYYYAISEELLRFPFAPEKISATFKYPLERAQQSVAGFLYRFYHDVQAAAADRS